MVRRDRLFAVCLILLSIICFGFTLDFPEQAAYYPRAILILIVLLSAVLFLKAKPADTISIKSAAIDFVRNRKLVSVLIALVLMIALMKPIGLYIELPIFVLSMLWILGYRNRRNSIIIAVALTIVIYLLFSVLLKVRIPMGLLKLL